MRYDEISVEIGRSKLHNELQEAMEAKRFYRNSVTLAIVLLAIIIVVLIAF